MNRGVACIVVATALTACSVEKRAVGPDQPSTPPEGPGDARIALVDDNAYQLSQGGRYFSWYGCAACHAQSAPGRRDLTGARWRYGDRFDRLYRAIADDHSPPYGARVPTEQLWQITAYVRSLATLDPAKRRRQDLDQRGEPRASNWTGPVR